MSTFKDSQGKVIINLQEYYNKEGNKGLKKAGKKLNKGEAVANCTDVNLEEHQIILLLSTIKRLKADNIRDFFCNHENNEKLIQQIETYLLSMQENYQQRISHKSFLYIFVGLLCLIISGFLAWKYIQFYSGLRVKTNNLTIGILTDTKDYKPLEEYLENKLIFDDFFRFLKGEKVRIFINGDRKIKYREAKERIINKEWDIAFTLSPMNSVVAKDNGYFYIARMFPNNPSFYQSALFVSSKNDNIKSLKEIKPTTVIALGEVTSASSFFMPAYDLYGKTLTIKKDNRGADIIEMVKNGEADIGAGAYGDKIKNDTTGIRIISISRNIPGASVYLSPRLSEQDRNSISKALAGAPQDIQKKANYAIDEEPDYSSFIGITRRVEEILQCSNFDTNPVNLFCPDTNVTNKNLRPVSSSITITGKINGYKVFSRDSIWLNVETSDGKNYRVVISPTLLNRIPNAGSPLNIKSKKVELTNVVTQQIEGNILEIVLNDASQLKLL